MVENDEKGKILYFLLPVISFLAGIPIAIIFLFPTLLLSGLFQKLAGKFLTEELSFLLSITITSTSLGYLTRRIISGNFPKVDIDLTIPIIIPSIVYVSFFGLIADHNPMESIPIVVVGLIILLTFLFGLRYNNSKTGT